MNQLAEFSVEKARLPQVYHGARIALEKCSRIDECKDWSDKAEALSSYAKQAKDETLMKMAIRIRDRAIRRAGELLKLIDGQGARTDQLTEGDRSKLTQRAAAEEAGFSAHQQVQAVRVANVLEDQFNEMVESDNPPTVTKLAQIGTKSQAKPLIDLKGRDPGEFNRSMHFVGGIEAYADECEAFELGLLLPGLVVSEANRLRAAIAKIDAVHDRIVTGI